MTSEPGEHFYRVLDSKTLGEAAHCLGSRCSDFRNRIKERILDGRHQDRHVWKQIGWVASQRADVSHKLGCHLLRRIVVLHQTAVEKGDKKTETGCVDLVDEACFEKQVQSLLQVLRRIRQRPDDDF